mmetsp:Transcript_7014/g.20541  ORF Transcript_7014/g.20541 Transcript_7014/m.20541 type:complete len:208 (-) Transcript_7014:307-930(-)
MVGGRAGDRSEESALVRGGDASRGGGGRACCARRPAAGHGLCAGEPVGGECAARGVRRLHCQGRRLAHGQVRRARGGAPLGAASRQGGARAAARDFHAAGRLPAPARGADAGVLLRRVQRAAPVPRRACARDGAGAAAGAVPPAAARQPLAGQRRDDVAPPLRRVREPSRSGVWHQGARPLPALRLAPPLLHAARQGHAPLRLAKHL